MYVAKVYQEHSRNMCETEYRYLNNFHKANIVNVPKVRLFCNDPEFHFSVLIISPVGIPVLPCPTGMHITPQMLINILQVLLRVHREMNIIHRDIKPENMFLSHNGSNYDLILSDWSSAVKENKECSYVGTPLYGEKPYENRMHIPSRCLDLRCFVRTAFALSKQCIPAVENTHEEATTYWTNISSDYPQFAHAMTLASDCDYDGLSDAFNKIWW